MRLYKTGILGGLGVCDEPFITVVTFGTCRKCSKDKLEQLNKQALRMVKPLDNGYLSDVV